MGYADSGRQPPFPAAGKKETARPKDRIDYEELIAIAPD